MRMGLREANQRFSKAVKAVKAGEEVILTDRGRPIAVIKPLPQGSRGDAAVRHLEAAGVLRPASTTIPLPRWTPRPMKGRPLSRTIREDRDAT
jgi:prevent-host-death family protein